MLGLSAMLYFIGWVLFTSVWAVGDLTKYLDLRLAPLHYPLLITGATLCVYFRRYFFSPVGW